MDGVESHLAENWGCTSVRHATRIIKGRLDAGATTLPRFKVIYHPDLKARGMSVRLRSPLLHVNPERVADSLAMPSRLRSLVIR